MSPSGGKGPLERGPHCLSLWPHRSCRSGGCGSWGRMESGQTWWRYEKCFQQDLRLPGCSPGAREAQANSDHLERVDEPSQSAAGAWPLACRCHADQRAGPWPREAGGPAQAHPVWAEGWLEGWLPGHGTGAVPEGLTEGGLMPGVQSSAVTVLKLLVILSLNLCFVNDVQG